jgi:3-phenylpropionate/trans-cinnamate dioxygenase ferredoxin reductase component
MALLMASGPRIEAPMVVLGGGLCGGNAAVTLREEGFAGRVVLISREPGVPFGRPPLSKTYLRSEEELDGWYVKPQDWYRQHDVERLQASVAGIDTAAHSLTLADGSELEYQKLLIATGGRNRSLRVPGAELPGVHQLRTLTECDAIKAEAIAGRHGVVVGLGFIGCEVAASLRMLGVRVTAVFQGGAPLERVLGGELAGAIAAIHRENGVELRSESQVASFEGSERVEAVVTAGGERVACDFAVAGIGIEPELAALAGTSLEQSNGLLVDERCRSSDPDVYGAGDIANSLHPVFGRVRVEHYNNAEKQGRAAARSMLGATDPYGYIHSFWSDQYDHSIEYVGHAESWDEFVVRGSLAERKLLGFYLRAGTLLAAAGLDRGGDPEAESDSEMAACARLVAMRATPGRAQLEDERVDLWSLAV